MLYADFIEYLQYWIDFDVLYAFSLATVITIICFGIPLFLGKRYSDTLDRAVRKATSGRYDLLTKKERKAWEELQEYKYSKY